jgi:hypothetical protein
MPPAPGALGKPKMGTNSQPKSSLFMSIQSSDQSDVQLFSLCWHCDILPFHGSAFKSSHLPSQKPPVNYFPDLTTWVRTIASLCLLLMGDLLAQV